MTERTEEDIVRINKIAAKITSGEQLLDALAREFQLHAPGGSRAAAEEAVDCLLQLYEMAQDPLLKMITPVEEA